MAIHEGTEEVLAGPCNYSATLVRAVNCIWWQQRFGPLYLHLILIG